MKIALVALSGVRVVDPELQRVGLNLPGFVERSQVIASLPSLGLLTLAGLTPEHHEVRYLEFAEVNADSPESLLRENFDLVALSSFTAMIKDAYRLSDALRAAGTTVVLGGLHVSLCPDEAAAHADTIVVGEAEPCWPSLLDDFAHGRLRTRYQATAPFDLAAAPMPRFDLLDPSRYNRLTVQTSRGCPWHCEFCAASIRLHPSYRTKPIPRILAELDRIREIWPVPFIEFADDNTFADPRHGHALMDALQGEHLRWFTETDISVGRDPALLRKMAAAGCAQILIGLEDPGSATEGLELKGNWKARQTGTYLDRIRRIQDHGITVNGCFILGLDHHTPDSFERIWEFIQRSELYEIQLTVLTPFPGTPLYHRLASTHRLTDPGAWEKCTLFDVMFEPVGMSADQLRAGLLELAGKVYSAEFTSQRRRRFARRALQRRLASLT